MSDGCYWCYVEMIELTPAADAADVVGFFLLGVAQLHVVSL